MLRSKHRAFVPVLAGRFGEFQRPEMPRVRAASPPFGSIDVTRRVGRVRRAFSDQGRTFSSRDLVCGKLDIISNGIISNGFGSAYRGGCESRGKED